MLPGPCHGGLTAMRTLLTCSVKWGKNEGSKAVTAPGVRPAPNWNPINILVTTVGGTRLQGRDVNFSIKKLRLFR